MSRMEVSETHPRVIIHIDIDCFYAQVEELRNPQLRDKPLGVQQKNIVVTCNYPARERGVDKLMPVAEARRRCPELQLVRGEDLTPYRQMSSRVFDVLQRFTPAVEKLGFDENYMDVTREIEERLQGVTMSDDPEVVGCVCPEGEMLPPCPCGCDRRLAAGTALAQEVREALHTELGLTTCAGIAHNKLLAKLVGGVNKPNNQTVLVPHCAATFLADLEKVRRVTGVGQKTEALLAEIGIRTVRDLQDVDIERLQRKFGHETATKLKDLSLGRDNMPVRATGRPKSIGLEDSCRAISVKQDVEEKFSVLLVRLVNQVVDDGRIPIAIKMTLRKFDPAKKTSHRETKQANILPSLFKLRPEGKLNLTEGGHEKLLRIVMRLFERLIDLRQPFNITLLGLAFSKFQERRFGPCSIANFLIKKSDVEVQSVTSLTSDGVTISPPGRETFPRFVSASPVAMENDAFSDTSVASDVSSEPELEPSPKKTRIGLLIPKRPCYPRHDPMDTSSPSKLRVADLRLNSLDSPPPPPSSLAEPTPATPDAQSLPNCVDPEVFKALPPDVQGELIATWTNPATAPAAASSTKSTCNTLHRYFITNK
ncbi:DNA polymerase iota [Lutzomyia longipalpis]|uniref:DNA polymerase iota n=1 Tax=Lutzomyia longipalpis TaxID=7200 RepID=UPI00248353F1|nr:DNA polymerase iota [Lutzomyia longipalpis]XP_055678233.1 DNA polymerase iota [Lutzomyia longipalpis]